MWRSSPNSYLIRIGYANDILKGEIMLFKKKKADIPEPEVPEIKLEKMPLVVKSTVKETNGYIEIAITCEENHLKNRDGLIKKDQIVCIDIWFGYAGYDPRYCVFIESIASKKQYDFERKEDAESLYNALSKLLKKKDVKSSASKKVV